MDEPTLYSRYVQLRAQSPSPPPLEYDSRICRNALSEIGIPSFDASEQLTTLGLSEMSMFTIRESLFINFHLIQAIDFLSLNESFLIAE